MRSKILILFLFSNFLLSQTPRNLGFENVTVENMVLTWKTINRDYKIEIDSLEKFSDKRSLKIEGKIIFQMIKVILHWYLKEFQKKILLERN